MKKILLIYPNNPLMGGNGTNNRVTQLIRMMKEIGFEIDLFSFENFSPDSNFKDFDNQNIEKLINKLFLYDFAKNQHHDEHGKSISLISRVKNKIKRKVANPNQKEELYDWTQPMTHKYFEEVLANNQYDVIGMFYTYTANLLKGKQIEAKKVYFMEDSMFIQQDSWNKGNPDSPSIGKLLDDELERLKVFDEYFCISNDERLFYEKVTGRRMNFLPHILPQGGNCIQKPVNERRWDIFFIGFNNPFNVEGLNWFLEEVYPYLNPTLKILLVGSATKEINVKYNNVDIIPFAPDLDEIYNDVKVSICPMLRGTGMKIKVIESISKGLPVVCTDKGVDGFLDKSESGCLVSNSPKEFADYINNLVSDLNYYNEIIEKTKTYYKNMFEKEKYIDLLSEKLI